MWASKFEGLSKNPFDRFSFLVCQILYCHLLSASNVGVKTGYKNWSINLIISNWIDHFLHVDYSFFTIRLKVNGSTLNVLDRLWHLKATVLLAPNVGVKSWRHKYMGSHKPIAYTSFLVWEMLCQMWASKLGGRCACIH